MQTEMMTALNQSFVLLGVGMLILFAFMGLMIIVLQGLEKITNFFKKKS